MNDNKPLAPSVVHRPTRSGMGVDTVIPSLLQWKPSDLNTPLHIDVTQGDTSQSVFIGAVGAGMSILATGHRGAWASVAQESVPIALASVTDVPRASKAAKPTAPWYRRFSQR